MTPFNGALPVDLILHIGSFMGPSDAVKLRHLNKEMRGVCDDLLKALFVKTFGERNPATEPPNIKIIARLLSWGLSP